MRRLGLLLLLLLILVCPPSLAAQAPMETQDFQATEKDLAVSKYDERVTVTLPERPLAFAVDLPYQASLEDKRSVDNPAYLRLSQVTPEGGKGEEIILKPGDKKTGVIRLIPGFQLRIELYGGKYNFLFIKSGASVKFHVKAPTLRFIATEERQRYTFSFAAAGFAEVDRWSWDLGDGSKGEGAQLKHAYRAPGSYRLSLVGYRGRTPLQSYTRDMVVPEILEVSPEVSPGEGAVEFKVHARSGLLSHYGELADCFWDFGDGTRTEIAEELDHVYKIPGRLRVTMTARHLSSSFTVQRTWDLNVRPLTVQNTGQVTPAQGGLPLKIEGVAQPRIDGAPVDLVYRWDFGDGNFAETPKAKHYFGEPGQYTVRLSLADRLHPELAIPAQSFSVKVLAPSLTVSPFAHPGGGAAPLEVVFIPGLAIQGYPVDLKYQWEFGDGESSKEAMPKHVYRNPGNYQVNLTIKDALNGTELRGQVKVAVAAAVPPVAAGIQVSVMPRAGTAPLSVECRAAGGLGGPNASYEWTFGDGGGATGASVMHTFKYAGDYLVVLTVRQTSAPGDVAQFNMRVTAR